MLTLPKHNRYEYSTIEERTDYSWPGGKRLAFCVTTNIEVYAYRRGTGWDPAKKGEPQQQRNYSWRDYGNRVGIWRLFDLFEQLNLPAAHNINSLLYEYHPQICERIRKRGDEVVGHGRTNAERQGDLWELDERRLIDDTTQEITRREGRPPRGWMGPAASESNVTPDLLKEAGYRYVMETMQENAKALADDYFIERKLYPNVDFYTGLIYRAMGFPIKMFTVLFALGRLPGWIAHWREMHSQPGKIGRPRQIYTGYTERDYAAIDGR